jgi:beta-xylosidase
MVRRESDASCINLFSTERTVRIELSSRVVSSVALCLFSLLPLIGALGQTGSTRVNHDLQALSRGGDAFKELTRGDWGDQGDGTYANPVLPGDFSDLDVIRVGSDFYAISSTMQYPPGMVLLHSKDLVNWKISGHVVDDLSIIDPELNWDKMNRAGMGIWAGAIRYHAGRFWVYFGTPSQGIFMSNSINPTGPWTRPGLVLDSAGWDDPCPFWDDDGQAYLITTHFSPEGLSGTRYNVHLFKMNELGDRLLGESDKIIHRSDGSEANKLYKIKGLYYHYYSEVAKEGRVMMTERSRSLNGPWEHRQLIHVRAASDKEPNQGGLIQLSSGKWYFLSHQGFGDWEGRAGVLLPVTWLKGWPIIGRVGSDGIGNMVWRGKKLIRGYSQTAPLASGGFSSRTLRPDWEWNYQPRADKWSLTERPGFLRLRAFQPLRRNDFTSVGNVLTQRAFRTRNNQVTVSFDVSGMANGQEAGLAHFATTFCSPAVIQERGVRRLRYNRNGSTVQGPPIPGLVVLLRSKWDFDGRSQFFYSIDGKSYVAFGEPYQLTWAAYRGDRIGIFTDNPNTAEGFVDVGMFQYSVEQKAQRSQ